MVINSRKIRQYFDWMINIKTTYEEQMDTMFLQM